MENLVTNDGDLTWKPCYHKRDFTWKPCFKTIGISHGNHCTVLDRLAGILPRILVIRQNKIQHELSTNLHQNLVIRQYGNPVFPQGLNFKTKEHRSWKHMSWVVCSTVTCTLTVTVLLYYCTLVLILMDYNLFQASI